MAELRLCSWNLALGRRLDGVLEAVGEFHGIDVLALQEASESESVAHAQRVAQALGPDYDFHQVATQELRGKPQANAVVWNRTRLGNARPQALELPSMRASGLPAWERRLLGRLREQARGAVLVEGLLDSDSVRVYSVHLDVVGFAHRLRQLSAVLGHASAAPRASLTIVAGDLNTFGVGALPSWGALATAAAAAGFVDVSAGIGWTHRTGWLRQKLDAVLARSQARLRHRAWTLPTTASDHLPVFVELAW